MHFDSAVSGEDRLRPHADSRSPQWDGRFKQVGRQAGPVISIRDFPFPVAWPLNLADGLKSAAKLVVKDHHVRTKNLGTSLPD